MFEIGCFRFCPGAVIRDLLPYTTVIQIPGSMSMSGAPVPAVRRVTS